MNSDHQRVLVAHIAGSLLAHARANGRSDECTVGDLVNTCLLDAAVIVASVEDDYRFDVLMAAAADTLLEMDECIPLSSEGKAGPDRTARACEGDLPAALEAIGLLRRH